MKELRSVCSVVRMAGGSSFVAGFALFCGCSGSGPAAVRQVSVDASEASTAAMEQYDKNSDGAIDQTELVACPPLAVAIAELDANKDSKLAADEIAARIENLYGSGSALATFNGTVALGGRPLAGAQVRFVPVGFLGEGVPAAEGVTDESGAVRPALGDADLPENLKGQPLIRPGMYLVEITHPEQQIPARYNTSTELGAIVDPTSRTGLSARFDLKAK
jgi:hypothetical protein